MKYSLNWTDQIYKIQDNDDVAEIIINYKPEDSDLLSEFIKHFPQNKTLTIYVSFGATEQDIYSICHIIEAENKKNDIKILLERPLFVNGDVMTFLYEQGFKYYFQEPCWDIELVHSFVNTGVTDVKIEGSLCFKALELADLFPNVNIRICPNKVAPIRNAGLPDLRQDRFKRFFIRPEDMIYYNRKNIIFEFADNHTQNVTYNIYHKQNYNADLQLLIKDLNCSIENKAIPPVFGLARTTCNYKCLFGKNCSICDECFSIAEKLSFAKLAFIENKKEGESNE